MKNAYILKAKTKLKQLLKSLTSINPNTEHEVDEVIQAIGGLENICETGACATRLRLRLQSTSVVDKERLTSLGAHGVVVLDNEHIQIIFGLKANMYSQIIESRLFEYK
ncbi:PTS transporter subunit EIIB [Photobacterium sp. BZF1]|uniref:glucose PTS transporter subunit EIIB n=1 Tax=Photobacterium sp. BZF1 TaxID=1904457 RepID=UPI0016535017|nr:glucose PTS transporter subunit EIIB [Photobacterium sp. BZF1]MBC7006026.1 PTS transporter subunit EIIB [Photobacterium sp. BZF1]